MNAREPVVLNHLERCDKRACGAQARVRVSLPSLLFIQFCSHHADEQPDHLYTSAEYVIYERALILGGA